MKRRILKYGVVALGLLAASIVGIYTLSTPALYAEAETIGRGNPTFEELSHRFQELAEVKGGVYAFDVLKIAPLPPGTDLHLMGHVVGEVLYQQENYEGIKDCTQDFRNACSHTIVIGTLNEYGSGEATIEMIRKACTLAPGGSGAYTMCFHGLGHGVFAYFGYDIPKAVEFCRRLGTESYGYQEYPQCVGGMIMELMGGGGHDTELWARAHETYLDPEDPLAPCNRTMIPYEAKSFCYSYLTPHLFEMAGADLGAPQPHTFPRAFGFCDKAADERLRKTCYGSFGKEFVPLAAARDIRSIDRLSDDAYRTAIGWCMLAERHEAKTACVGQAVASIFWGGENDPDASFRFCSLVSDSSVRESCYSDISINIASYMSGEQRIQLCEKLPAEHVATCKESDIAADEQP